MTDYQNYYNAIQESDGVDAIRQRLQDTADEKLSQLTGNVLQYIQPVKEVGDLVLAHYLGGVAQRGLSRLFKGDEEEGAEAPEEIEMSDLSSGATGGGEAGGEAGVSTGLAYASVEERYQEALQGQEGGEAGGEETVGDLAPSALTSTLEAGDPEIVGDLGSMATGLGSTVGDVASTATDAISTATDAVSTATDVAAGIGDAVSGAISGVVGGLSSALSAIPGGVLIGGVLIGITELVDHIEGKRQAQTINLPVLNPSATLGIGD